MGKRLKNIKEILKERAAQMYREGQITFSKAASQANLTLWEMENYLVEKGFKSEYSLDDLDEEMKMLQRKY